LKNVDKDLAFQIQKNSNVNYFILMISKIEYEEEAIKPLEKKGKKIKAVIQVEDKSGQIKYELVKDDTPSGEKEGYFVLSSFSCRRSSYCSFS